MSDNIADNMFSDGKLDAIINNNNHDPWAETRFRRYVHLDPGKKGQWGELFVEKYCTCKELRVEWPENREHDRLINNIKTEIKFTLAQRNSNNRLSCTNGGIKSNIFAVNHVASGKDWERLLICAINGPTEDKWHFGWFTKEEFNTLKELPEEIFKKQQGGKKSDNDDWMCIGKKVSELLNIIHTLEEWDFTKEEIEKSFRERCTKYQCRLKVTAELNTKNEFKNKIKTTKRRDLVEKAKKYNVDISTANNVSQIREIFNKVNVLRLARIFPNK